MNLSKKLAVKELSKFILIKLGFKDQINNAEFLALTENGYSVLLKQYEPKLRELKILNGEQVNLDNLEKEVLNIFKYIPIIKLPFTGGEMVITKEDILELLASLNKAAQSESVICLPCN